MVLAGMPMDDFAGQHVDQLDPGAAEAGVGLGVVLQDEAVATNCDVAAEHGAERFVAERFMAERFMDVADLRAAAKDRFVVDLATPGAEAA